MHDESNNAAWLERWEIGRTGWHEPDGNANLKAHWTGTGRRVLVPLCGKTPDLAWLESRGNDVVGVELSDIAARDFFVEHGLDFECVNRKHPVYAATGRRIAIVCGDYFEIGREAAGGPFDACYDRGALVAIDPAMRADYVAHTLELLGPGADYLLIAVEYDQSVADGPPYSLGASMLAGLLPGLDRIAAVDDLENCPPKFHEAGLEEFHEVIYKGRVVGD